MSCTHCIAWFVQPRSENVSKLSSQLSSPKNIIRKEVYSDYYRARPYHGLTAELQLYHVGKSLKVVISSAR